MAPTTHVLECQSPTGSHRLSYSFWEGPADGPTHILVHGLARNSRDFDRLAERLAERGPVYAPDMPGRGLSDWLPSGADYTYALYFADVAALIQRTGATSIDYVGTSMGGIIGMYLAIMPESRIRRLVLNDIGPFISKDALKRLATYVGGDPRFETLDELDIHMRRSFATFGPIDPDDWRHLRDHSFRRLPDGGYALHYDPAIGDSLKGELSDVDLWPAYQAIRCPLLVIHGALSDLLVAATIAEMRQRGPRVTVFEVADAGHAPPLLKADQIDAIDGFFRQP